MVPIFTVHNDDALKALAGVKPGDFKALCEKAHAAGLAAGNAVTPAPMVVSYRDSGGDMRRDVIEDGLCGFAWVTIKPGNSPLARYMKKAGLARKAYGGGVSTWVSEFNQSIARKEAYARAYAAVLNEAGFPAYAESRLD